MFVNKIKSIIMILNMLFAVSCLDMYNDAADEVGAESEAFVTTLAGSFPIVESGYLDGNGYASRFDTPIGVTTDGENLYICDTYNNSVRKVVLATDTVTTIAGSYPVNASGFSDGIGTAARFNQPTYITYNSGILYLCDSGNHAIRKMELSTGIVTTIAGSYPAVASGFLDNTGTSARFNNPRGIETDGTFLYIADSGNHAIRKIELSTGIVTTIAGAYPVATSGLIDNTGTSSRFNEPFDLTLDRGILYIADTYNNAIRKIVISTGIVTTLAGSYPAVSSGYTDGIGIDARFYNPRGITTDGDNVYVSDTYNNVIRKIIVSSARVVTIAGSYPSIESGNIDGDGPESRFGLPREIVYKKSNLYLCDLSNHSIRKIKLR